MKQSGGSRWQEEKRLQLRRRRIRKENKVSNSGNSQDTKEKNSGNSSDKQKLLTNTTNKTQNKKFHYNNSRTENTKELNVIELLNKTKCGKDGIG